MLDTPIRLPSRRPLMLLLMTLVLAACGQKGPLYIPGQETHPLEPTLQTSVPAPPPETESTDTNSDMDDETTDG